MPASSAALDRFDAVIVSDVSPDVMDSTRMHALQGYVRERGGGLIFAAGENTYGEAGFSGTLLEKLLPVEFKSEEKRKDLALILCLDRSYSMKGRPIALAKAGARAVLELLEEQHHFGVIAFDSQPHEAVPLQYVRSRRRAEDLIDRIQASGQTNIYPALATAWRALQNHPAKRKHVIVLSDGDTAPADFDRLLKRMQDAKITVSTVTIGRTGNPELMAKIASLGGGKAYVAEELEQVPQIFVRGHAQRVADRAVRGAVPPGGQAQGRGAARTRLRPGAASPGLRQHQVEGGRRGVPGHLGAGAHPGALAVRVGAHRAVRLRREEPLGGRMAALGRVWQVLGAARARHHAA